MNKQVDIKDLYLMLGERDVQIHLLQEELWKLRKQLAALTPQSKESSNAD